MMKETGDFSFPVQMFFHPSNDPDSDWVQVHVSKGVPTLLLAHFQLGTDQETLDKLEKHLRALLEDFGEEVSSSLILGYTPRLCAPALIDQETGEEKGIDP